jgi:hypothetical protein
MSKAVPLTGLVTGSVVFAVLAVGCCIGANVFMSRQANSRLSKTEHRR